MVLVLLLLLSLAKILHPCCRLTKVDFDETAVEQDLGTATVSAAERQRRKDSRIEPEVETELFVVAVRGQHGHNVGTIVTRSHRLVAPQIQERVLKVLQGLVVSSQHLYVSAAVPDGSSMRASRFCTHKVADAFLVIPHRHKPIQ